MSGIKQILKKIFQIIKSERRRLFFFGVVGVGSLALNVGLYALLSRVLWPSGDRTLQYSVVVVVVTAINFEANRHFTFSSQRSMGALLRFGMVAIVAWLLSTLFFWIGHAVFHFYDLAIIVGNTFLIAFFTFSSHRLFTFHQDPWRFVKRRGAVSSEQ